MKNRTVQSNLNFLLSILTSNSNSIEVKQFVAILTPGLAQHPSSEIQIAKDNGVI
ncbi:hypothetical protein GCM10023339_69880 [Alloalcanivorax gelatiniphagus]